MRLLLIHADQFSYSVTAKAPVTGLELDPTADGASCSMEEVLVAFGAVEKHDEHDPPGILEQAWELIATTADQVGARRVMIYPYAHLASDLASPRPAHDILVSLHESLAENRRDLEVTRAPFGYYKAFQIKCKGHPLSELARTLVATPPRAELQPREVGQPSLALQAEKSLHSEWRIYLPDGSHHLADKHVFTTGEGPGLRQLFDYERAGSRAAEHAPPHVRLMRAHELVDYEPASDSGNMRWYPQGILVKRLLEQHVTAMVTAYGAMEVETPLMYDQAHPALSKYLQRFPARQYLVNSDERDYFLRFAACFGQYMVLRDMNASHRNLPVRLYELTHHSFRREQGGEVSGLRRLRAFTMPDMHSLVSDVQMAKSEFLQQVRLCLRWIEDIGVDCVPAIRFVRSFLDEHPDFIGELMRLLGCPALVEVWEERFFYFVAKFELNFIDNAQKAACLSTVQIDVENSERFEISYIGEDGSRQLPLLLHTSVSGSVDRNVYAILENQARLMSKGQKGTWPIWLAPTQVRLLPVSDDHVQGALRLAERIPFRVDVDDRSHKMGKKVREAEKEWVPYIIVIGDRELRDQNPLRVRPRTGDQFQASVGALVSLLEKQTEGRPRRPANGPRRLSRRPIFVG